MRPPRVAYFPDSFHEVNGVAHTSRNFVDYAQRHNLPFLCVRAGNRARPVADEGSVRSLELPRSNASVVLEKDLAFDPFFWRHADLIEEQLLRFDPDLLHMTGPSELGFFALYFAWKLRLPLAASWHTNVHEYAARRLAWLTGMMPPGIGSLTDRGIENTALEGARALYDFADLLFAPNPEICGMLERTTGKLCQLMRRGVDTTLFAPSRRCRDHAGLGTRVNPFVLGYVGRLSIEKNVLLLPRINRQLEDRGVHVRFLIVGHGVDEAELRRELPNADFAGVLHGAALAQAYADMDLFVFPSHTDTFGNVVLEALASGIPAVVTPDGGPRFIVRDRQRSLGVPETGAIVPDDDFARTIAAILTDPSRLAAMRVAARDYALECSWNSVFNRVYEAYRPLLLERLSAGSDLSPRWVVSSPR